MVVLDGKIDHAIANADANADANANANANAKTRGIQRSEELGTYGPVDVMSLEERRDGIPCIDVIWSDRRLGLRGANSYVRFYGKPPKRRWHVFGARGIFVKRFENCIV